jgi:3D (Asp-Asp-Asp) domain-containing protein
MKKATQKFNTKKSKIVFASFLLAGLFNQLTSTLFVEAMAQDNVLGNSSDIFISSDSILEEEILSKEATIQDSVFIQPACSMDDECVGKEEEKEKKDETVKHEYNRVVVTAYSSTPDQTDSSPFITANGSQVRDGIVACNFLPFGTKVRFPEYSGDKIFTVEDRMAKKNNEKMDIWMSSRNVALEFGVKSLAVEVIE